MRRAICVALAICAGISILGAGVAGAHKVKYKSIVEIDGYEFRGAFLGGVGSFDNKRCSRGRKVSVWKLNPGAMDGPFGTAKTNRKGAWRLEVQALPGTYYAVVKPKAIGRSKGHRHLCRGDESSRFQVGALPFGARGSG